MSGRISLVVFLSTLALTIPATWNRTAADGPQDGAAERPPVTTLALGDTSVQLAVDRGEVEAGGQVHLTLVATSDARRQQQVLVAVYGESGSPMSRMPSPPRVVETRQVDLVAQSGGGLAKTIALTLPGPADGEGSPGQTTRYTVVVRGSGGSSSGSAAITVNAVTPEAFHITVASVSSPDASGRIEAVLRVKNVSAKAVNGLSISINAAGLSADPVAPIAILSPGETREVRLSGVLAADSGDGPIQLQVYGYAGVGGSAHASGTVARAHAAAPIAFAEPPPAAE